MKNYKILPIKELEHIPFNMKSSIGNLNYSCKTEETIKMDKNYFIPLRNHQREQYDKYNEDYIKYCKDNLRNNVPYSEYIVENLDSSIKNIKPQIRKTYE